MFLALLFFMMTYQIYKSIANVPKSWSHIAGDDIFLSVHFLKALEQSSPNNIQLYFVGIFLNADLVGIALVQHLQINFSNAFKKPSVKVLKRFGNTIISQFLKGTALIVGNLMHTGQHGFKFNENVVCQAEVLKVINMAIIALRKDLFETQNIRIKLIVYKDFFEKHCSGESQNSFNANKFFKANLQPNMLFKNNYNSFDAYVSAFNKKYRRRYRTARKKAKPIICKELDLATINNLSAQLYQLYDNVSNNAAVNTFKLSKKHFVSLKTHLQDNFKVFGYFLEDELIGFYTLILNNDTLETYFLGYNPSYQHKYQLYLNMLYDMAAFGYNYNFKHIVFARTALEIKSSIGAKPHDMFVYLKYTGSYVINFILKYTVKYANPVRDWQERHPFKE